VPRIVAGAKERCPPSAARSVRAVEVIGRQQERPNHREEEKVKSSPIDLSPRNAADDERERARSPSETTPPTSLWSL
jgi:hypothetical protein